MSYEENIRAILECNFSQAQDELIDNAVKSILAIKQYRSVQDFVDKCIEYEAELGRSYIKIPDNATNGDVIKTVFPNAETWVEQFDTPVMRFDVPNNDTLECFNLIWWNAPYERG